jgi:hypothetical protein
MHAFVCGDFNANGVEEKDNVCRLLGSQGWTSSFTQVHGNGAGVTHLTHRNEQLAVDFICQQHIPATLDTSTSAPSYIHYQPTSAVVVPETVSHATWPASFTVSDHRPVLVTFTPFVYDSAASAPTGGSENKTAAAARPSTPASSTSATTSTPVAIVATSVASSSSKAKKPAVKKSAAVVVDDDDKE